MLLLSNYHPLLLQSSCWLSVGVAKQLEKPHGIPPESTVSPEPCLGGLGCTPTPAAGHLDHPGVVCNLDTVPCPPCAAGQLSAKAHCSSVTLPTFWHSVPGFGLGGLSLLGQLMLWASTPAPQHISCEDAVRPPGLWGGFWGAGAPVGLVSELQLCLACWSKPWSPVSN